MNRRKFINNIARGSFLASLGTMSALFVIRNKKNQNTQCSYEFVCKNCNKIDNCMLPEASLFKYEQQVKDNK